MWKILISSVLVALILTPAKALADAPTLDHGCPNPAERGIGYIRGRYTLSGNLSEAVVIARPESFTVSVQLGDSIASVTTRLTTNPEVKEVKIPRTSQLRTLSIPLRPGEAVQEAVVCFTDATSQAYPRTTPTTMVHRQTTPLRPTRKTPPEQNHRRVPMEVETLTGIGLLAISLHLWRIHAKHRSNSAPTASP